MAQPAQRVHPPNGLTSLRFSTLTARQQLIVLLLCVAACGWPTLRSLLAYAQGDTPLSFVPFIPVLAALYAVRLFDARSIAGRAHDPFVDGLCFVALFLVSGVLLLLLPVTMGWYYWLDRLDVPGLVLLFTALVTALWGLRAVVGLFPALLYLLLAWPLPWLLLDRYLLPPMTQLTGAAVQRVVPLIPLGISPDPQSAAGLLIPFRGHTSTLIVSQACSGVNGAFGLMVLALPLAMLARGHLDSRAFWLVLGVALSWTVNLVRITVIAICAVKWGPGTTVALLHPEIGLVLFALSFALLLWLAPRCGVDLSPVWRRGTTSEDSRPPQRQSRRKLAAVAAILVAGALTESNLAQFDWLSDATLPRVGLARASDLFHPPAGWHIASAQSIGDWTPFFGASAVSSVMTVASRHRPPVDVQAILTRDKAAFSSYGVENCYTFHGYTIQSVHRVTLGYGVTATLVDFRTQRWPLAALYWIQPVQTPQGLYHRRIIFIAGQHGGLSGLHASALTAPASGVVQPVQSLATTIADVFSPWFGGSAGPAYRASNAELQAIGEAVVSDERRSRA